MAVGHAPPRGWSKRTYRLFYERPIFPLAAMVALIYGFLQYPFFVQWICFVRFGERMWDYWRTPLVAGVAPTTILLVLDGVIGAWLLWGFVRWLRKPWRRDRVPRVAYLAALGNLALLSALHFGLAQTPSKVHAWQKRAIWCTQGDDSVTVTVHQDLVPRNMPKRLGALARALGGKGGEWDEYIYCISTPGPRLTIPLHGFDLVILEGELIAGGKSYGKVGNESEVQVTLIGIKVRLHDDTGYQPWEYRGDLPH